VVAAVTLAAGGCTSSHDQTASTGSAGATAAGGTKVITLAPVDASGLPEASEVIADGGTAKGCEAGSDSVSQAYRCFQANGVYDPCWLDNTDAAQASVLCQRDPWDTRIIRFRVAQGGLPPFSGPVPPVDLNRPWGVRLADGEQCLAVQGTHDSYEGKVVDYGCGNNGKHVLLRTLKRSSPQWTYESAYFDGATSYKPGPLERVAAAWYASPDNGAAFDAKANDCTATALAYAAQAYEASHGEPSGPLPDVNAQACSHGYAEMVFTPSAPPRYTAACAFKATPAGWQEIGRNGYIAPGSFGMPVSVGATINGLLTSGRLPDMTSGLHASA
jgi:hypothetical protein